MNRPALPFAISSVPATELPFADLDHADFSATIAALLAAFDARDAAASVSVVAADAGVDAFRPVSARAHVNQARRSPTRSRLLASA